PGIAGSGRRCGGQAGPGAQRPDRGAALRLIRTAYQAIAGIDLPAPAGIPDHAVWFLSDTGQPMQANAERLVDMINNISKFFESHPSREEAVAGVLTHVKTYWDPRMKRAIAEPLRNGGEGLREIAPAAVAQPPAPAPVAVTASVTAAAALAIH